MGGARDRGKPRALSDMTGPAQSTMVKTVYVQDVGWAVQVGPTTYRVLTAVDVIGTLNGVSTYDMICNPLTVDGLWGGVCEL